MIELNETVIMFSNLNSQNIKFNDLNKSLKIYILQIILKMLEFYRQWTIKLFVRKSNYSVSNY